MVTIIPQNSKFAKSKKFANWRSARVTGPATASPATVARSPIGGSDQKNQDTLTSNRKQPVTEIWNTVSDLAEDGDAYERLADDVIDEINEQDSEPDACEA